MYSRLGIRQGLIILLITAAIILNSRLWLFDRAELAYNPDNLFSGYSVFYQYPAENFPE